VAIGDGRNGTQHSKQDACGENAMSKKMVYLSDVRMNDLKRRAKIIKKILRHLDAMDRDISIIEKKINNMAAKVAAKI
jgi:hypothetical protein